MFPNLSRIPAVAWLSFLCRGVVGGGHMPMLTLLVTVLVELGGGTVVSISFGDVLVGKCGEMVVIAVMPL